MSTSRIKALQEGLRSHGLSCAFLVPGPNLRYLTGLNLEAFERMILMAVPVIGDPAFIVPELEANKVRALVSSWERASCHCAPRRDTVYSYADSDGPINAARRALLAANLNDLSSAGAEFLHMRLLDRDIIERAGGPGKFSDLDPVIAEMRSVKDADELAALERAAEIVDIGIAAAASAIAPGVTEREVATAIESAMLKAGADSVPFNAVLSGPNAALPHGETSDCAIREGDMVICDIVATYRGYSGDITRTFAAGHPAPEMEAVYQAVLAANRAACTAARPGLTGAQLDSIAREVISSAGFGEYFIHRTGHGLGLEIHEEPYIVQGADRPLKPGMVFTIEPGAYLPGIGGVRIEDDLALTADGRRILTTFPREAIMCAPK